jgi:hypothetical protein
VRAAEDGRSGPLPTLDECIAMLPKSDSSTSAPEHENKGVRMTKSNRQAADYRAEASEREAPAASGGNRPETPEGSTQAASGGGEPVAWMCEWTDHAELYQSKSEAERAADGDVVPQPLYRSTKPELPTG